jgi:hypothetical protein
MGIEDQRVGEVDTEAIFAAIAYGTEINPKTGKPRLSADLLDILGEVNGSAAIAWLKVNGNPDVMELARISTSPLIWGQTAKGTFVFASTKDAIERATKNNDLEIVHWDFAAEGDYYRIEGGRVAEYQTFDTDKSWRKPSHTYVYSKKDDDKPSTSPKENDKAETSSRENSPSDSSDNGTGPFISPPALHAKMCVTFGNEIPEPTTNYHFSWYKKREERIDDYIAALVKDANQPTLASTEAGHKHAFARVGSWVLTDVGTYSNVRAQIFLLPMSFPKGSYILRALIPNQRYHNDYEPVLIERQAHEFVMIKNPEEAKTPGEVENAK